MANRIFDLRETKGQFQLNGHISGTAKEKFYTTKKTKNGNDFRRVNFGCEYDDKKTVYLNLNGMPQQNVYFSKRDPKSKKTETKAVPWANRNKFSEEGFRMIGVSLGLTKTTDKEGNIVNLKKIMAPYDACEEIKKELKDESSVFIRGNLEYSTFTNDKGEVNRSLNYVPNQISLYKESIDFDKYDEEHQPKHDFEQEIVFMGISKEKDENDRDTGRFVVEAKIITYSDIVDTEFIVVNPRFAANMKKTLKPYHSILVHGHIEVTHNIQDAEEDDGWGDANPLKAISGSTKIEMVITGADKDSIDTESYDEKSVTDAIKKIRAEKDANNKFVANDNDDADWGDESTDAVEDDDTPW